MSRMGRSVRWALLLVAATNVLACGNRPLSPPPPDPTAMNREHYVIGVTDVLDISVWKNPELSVTVPVRPDGRISVPLVDDVQAEGLQTTELKEIITRELSEYIASPIVTVVVTQMNSQFISVIGAVGQNTRIPMTKELRVLEAIATAGGFTTFADKGDIRIVRRIPGGQEVEYRFDYGAYIKGKAPGTNIVLKHGDTIIVPE
jgi:polysaccharide export outer membrane protein